jgi:hypothetical protein
LVEYTESHTTGVKNSILAEGFRGVYAFLIAQVLSKSADCKIKFETNRVTMYWQ